MAETRPTATEEVERLPKQLTKRIVVVGDGQEAALTAYSLTRQKAIQDYHYQVYLIQGVRKDSDDAGKRFQWVPFSGLKFSLQYLFADSLSRGKIFERHFVKYLQLRLSTSARQ